jgi:hypothetical protein
MSIRLTPGVRPAQCGVIFRIKRTVYYRYSKLCPVCARSFVSRNANAKTCSSRCRTAHKRVKAIVEKEKEAAANAAAKKRKRGSAGAAPRKKTKR